MRAVPLHGKHARGRVAWVSERDYGRVIGYRWNVQESVQRGGTRNGPYAYARVKIDGRWVTLYLHVLIMGEAGVDHRNGYGLDCTRRNLRKADKSQNGSNRGAVAGATSRFKGVSWARRERKWRTVVDLDGQQHGAGYFADEAAAARAVDAKALELHGEFAWLNRDHFPEVAW